MQSGFQAGGASPLELVLGVAGFVPFIFSLSADTLILGILNIIVGIILRVYFQRNPGKKVFKRLARRFWKERRRSRELERRLKKYEEV